MKKLMYAMAATLVVASGFLFANREIKNETAQKISVKTLTSTERDLEKKKWEATSAGVNFKKWEVSPAGKKVYAAEDKIWKNLKNFTGMEGVVTSLSLPQGSKLGFGMMIRINNDDYIVTFDAEKTQLKQLKNLKVNDKIVIKSHYVSHAPKYFYPIISCESAAQDGKVIFKRIPRKGGC